MAILLKNNNNQLNKDNPAFQDISVGTRKHYSLVKAIKGISPKAWLRIGFFVACIVAFFVLTFISSSIVDSLYDQRAAERWINEKAASQVSLFFEPGAKLEIKDINKLRYNIATELGKVLADDPASHFEEDENASSNPFKGPYTYAYSALGKISLTSKDNENAKADNLNAIGVGGDFFLFHPVDLVAGRYLSPDDMMRDGLLIDTNTAGRLFGSFDAIGKAVILSNHTYYVRGVYRPDDSHFSVGAGSDGGYVFMDYQSLSEDGVAGEISNIDVVSKDPVSGFMYNLIKDKSKNGFAIENYVAVQNTGRYSVPSLINVIFDWGNRSMQTRSVVFPYWENIGRAYEDVLALLLIFRFILLLIVAIMLIAYLYYRYSHKTWNMHSIKVWFEDIQDKYRKKQREKVKKKIREGESANKWKDF